MLTRKKDIGAYCIHMRSRKDREEKITRKLNELLGENTWSFIDAITPQENACLVEWYGWHKEMFNPKSSEFHASKDSEIACFLSHLKALRYFYDSSHSFALIMEDDISFIENFESYFDQIQMNLPNEWDLVLLSYYGLLHGNFAGKFPKRGNLLVSPPPVFGGYLYFVNRTNLWNTLNFFDKPYFYNFEKMKQSDVTSELIINCLSAKRTKGQQVLAAYPPLAIEETEGNFSSIRETIDHHKEYFSQFMEKWNYS
jgi:GR25 family glycosyltransferase involved in LPS biosynthesis